MKRSGKILYVVAVWLMVVAGWSPWAGGQDEPAEVENRDVPEIRVERNIYLPYDDLRKVFEEDGRSVFLPYQEFQALWDQLEIEKEENEEKPPREAAVVSAGYAGRVSGEVATVEAVLKVESFKEGWAVLPLGGVGMRVAAADAGEAILNLGEKGYELLIPKAGSYELKMTLHAKVTEAGGRRSMELSVPKTPVSRFELAVPETGWEFDLEPATAYTVSLDDAAVETNVAFFFGDAGALKMGWRKKGAGSALEALLLATADVSVKVVPGAVRSAVNVGYRILRAGAGRFELSVSEPHEVLDVAGENIKQWVVKAGDDAGAQILEVELHAPVEGAFSLAVELESAVETLPASVAVPEVVVLGASRQSGTVSVTAGEELVVEPGETRGLVRQGGGGEVASGEVAVGSYRYLRAPAGMVLDVKRAEPEVSVESWTQQEVRDDETEISGRVVFTVKRAPIYGVKIGLPAGYEGVTATGTGIEGQNVVTGVDGGEVLEIEFGQGLTGVITVEIAGRRLRGGTEDVVLPVFGFGGVERHDGKVGVYVEDGLSPNTNSLGGFRKVDSATYQGETGGALPTLAFRYRDAAEAGVLGIEQKEPQVLADVLGLLEVREQVAMHRWEIGYDVLYAGVESFLVRVPSEIADDLRVENAELKEVVKGVDAAGVDGVEAIDESVLWRVVLRDKVKGAFVVKLSVDVPLPAAGAGEAVTVTVPELEAVDVFRETGQVAVIKEANLEVIRPEVQNLEEIDPKELRGHLSKPGVFLAYKFRERPLGLALEVSKNKYLPVPAALVTYAAVDTVVSTDLGMTSEAVLWLRNNSKQFLGVELPEGASVLSSVFVDGVPQEPMKRAEQAGFLVRLPAREPGDDQEVAVRFAYSRRGADEGAEMDSSGAFDVAPLKLLDADILQSQVTLWLPPESVYTEFRGSMRQPVEDRGWGRYRGLFHWLVPALGPDVLSDHAPQWSAPPSMPENRAGGFSFDLRKEGERVRLHRLDRPTVIGVVYRSRTVAYTLEALAGLVAFGIGLLLWRAGLGAKFGYVIVVGLGSLVVGGAVGVAWVPVTNMVFVGVGAAVGFWVLFCLWGVVRKLAGRWKRREVKKKEKNVKAVVEEAAKDPAPPEVAAVKIEPESQDGGVEPFPGSDPK